MPRFDEVGMFWQDLHVRKKGERAARPLAEIPETGWSYPRVFPNLSSAKAISFDVETYDPELQDHGPGWARGKGHIVGFSVAVEGGYRWYYPIKHIVKPEQNHPYPEHCLAWLRDTLKGTQPKIGANLIYDVGWCRQEGITVGGDLIDIQFGEALLDDRAKVNLDSMANHWLGESKKTDLLKKWVMDSYAPGKEVWRKEIYRSPPCLVGPYGEMDADLPIRIAPKLYDRLWKEGLIDLFRMECGIINLLIEMRFKGVTVNLENAQVLRDDLDRRVIIGKEELRQLAGFEVNIDAAASIKKVFDKFGLKYYMTKPTKQHPKGQPSFRKEFLATVDHPSVKLILDIRRMSKLKNTFVEGYILNGHVNGKVHGSYHPLRGEGGGTIVGRFCVDGDTVLELKDRTVKIKDFEPNGQDYILSHKNRWRKVLRRIYKGREEMFCVVLENGSTVKCTANHRLLTPDGWSPLSALKVGDPVSGYIQKTGQRSHVCEKSNRFISFRQEAYDPRDAGRADFNLPNNQFYLEKTFNEREIFGREGSTLFAGQHEFSTQSSEGRESSKLYWDYKGQRWLSDGPEAGLVHRKTDTKACTNSHSCNVQGAWTNRHPGYTRDTSYRRGQEELRFEQSCPCDTRGTLSSSPYSIKEISPVGEADVWDIEVEGDHSYRAGGMYHHNSSSQPNLTNLPIRDKELGKKIRSIFTPDIGHKCFRHYDYSQFQFRALVHYAVGPGAEEARQRYIRDPTTDYHNMVKKMVEEATMKEWDRRLIKNLNFGKAFGMGDAKAGLSTGLKGKELEDFLKAYDRGIPFAKKTMKHIMSLAEHQGWIKTVLGRKARFDLWEPVTEYDEDGNRLNEDVIPLPYEDALRRWGRVQRAYLHTAEPRLLQGTEGDTIKMALYRCWNEGVFKYIGVPRLLVHDEMDYSDDGTAPEEAWRYMRHVMETAVPLKVPILVGCDIGPNWGVTTETCHHCGKFLAEKEEFFCISCRATAKAA